MILFYAPGASSQAPHILLRAGNLPFTLEKVDLIGQTWAGGNYAQINPKSCVPALRRDDGSILTECAPILLYIADQVPAHRLAPRFGSEARYRTLEWLNFIATELHKNFITPERHEGRGANFLPRTRSGQRDVTIRVSPRLSHVERQLAESKYLVDGNFSAPDAYLFTMLTWAIRLGMDLAAWQNLQAFHARVAALDPVRMALAAEGPPHSLAAERA